ncbi:MAG TPA: bifunctional riboflavin kinase/FAD synthetase [Thermohalobaculum sp.]|nr:bifunctional riboflavin kinase/FAD synthetase [Thermohalobaculum sp.]
MQVIRGYEGLSEDQRGASAALGNFDGVHRGHQALIAEAARAGAPLSAPVGVITFEPHPRRFFQPDAPPFRLTPAPEKARILAALGVERVHELTFDAALAGTEPEDFAGRILAAGLGIRHLVVGENFRFGRARRGDAAMLRAMGERLGFTVSIVHLLEGATGRYSSTAVRVHIEQGNCEEAARHLGRWHAVRGPVIEGDRRGRSLGFPTANLALGEQIVPRHGIYAARTELLTGPHAGVHDGVASIGVRPTFGDNAANFEVHLFDFEGDLYGAEIAAGLVSFLRPEARFETPEALTAQMRADAALARHRLAHARIPA